MRPGIRVLKERSWDSEHRQWSRRTSRGSILGAEICRTSRRPPGRGQREEESVSHYREGLLSGTRGPVRASPLVLSGCRGRAEPRFLTWHSTPFLASRAPAQELLLLLGSYISTITPACCWILQPFLPAPPPPHTGHAEQSPCVQSPIQSQECVPKSRKQLGTPSELSDTDQ